MGYYGGGGCGFRGTHLMALRLLQPEAHVHLAIHRRRRGEVLLRLLTLAHASVELAEAEVAVGDDRAHAQLNGEGHGLPEGGFGFFGSRRIAMRCDLAQNQQRQRLLRPSLVVAGEREGLPPSLTASSVRFAR